MKGGATMSETVGRPPKLTEEDVLQTFNESRSLYLTSRRIADKHDCTAKTARKRLDSLVEDGILDCHSIDSKRSLYSRTDTEVAEKIIGALDEHLDLDEVDRDQLAAFAEEPFKVLPKSDEEYYIVAPRFVPFHLGRLHEVDDAWQTFTLDKFSVWTTDLPESIRDQVGFEQQYDDLWVRDGLIELSNPDEQDKIWDDLGGQEGGLQDKPDDDSIQIKQDCEIEVLASLIDRGHLPFDRQPIDEEILRDDPETISLRGYQEQAWERFCETGQIGVYWPPSGGKTYLSLYAGHRVPGRKLVVVPSSTLEDQWINKIQEMGLDRSEWEVRSYQYLAREYNITDYQNENAPELTIFDECHRLPADLFSRLATIDTARRIGLSASPYREDGRTEYIFALTGFPVGVDWTELVARGHITFPPVHVYLYESPQQKRDDLIELVQQRDGTGTVFCDRLDQGNEIASELGVPFISGETPGAERSELFDDNDIVVASRVMDEGFSAESLVWTIEHSFHGGSRRQEMQRYGRTMHSKEESQHIIQMTAEEFENHGERLEGLKQREIEIQREWRS